MDFFDTKKGAIISWCFMPIFLIVSMPLEDSKKRKRVPIL